jgi:uncharacterized protein (TIGR00290 family)
VIWALASSGGKDSTLALDRAVQQGHDVRYLFNLVHHATNRVRFHGVRADLIGRQARALGLTLHQRANRTDDFEAVFLAGLEDLVAAGVGGIIFGNIHLADVRGWYEERTRSKGLEHDEPLWKGTPERLVREFVERGYRARITSVDLARANREWLGREIDEALLEEILASPDVDVAGEFGEFHSFVFDGPLFDVPVECYTGGVHEEEGHAMIDLLPGT